jgi:hypothetical protein
MNLIEVDFLFFLNFKDCYSAPEIDVVKSLVRRDFRFWFLALL